MGPKSIYNLAFIKHWLVKIL